MTATTREQVVIADYDYGDVDIERAIVEKAGFELIAAQCKTEDEVIDVARDAAAVVAQYARISARVSSSVKRRSAPRSSVSSPARRRRCSPSAGSSRVASTTLS